MLLNIEKVYQTYLLKVSEIERALITKMPGYYAIGGAGSCYMKQMLKVAGKEADPIDEKTMRLFRLGTLLHNDIEQAVKEMKTIENIEVTTEEGVMIDDFGVRGYYDICCIDHEAQLIETYDVKSIKAYQWKLKFGQVKNKDQNPAVLNELQLATYTIAKLKENLGYTAKMYLIFYKKDDSSIKTIQVNPSYLHSALMYWKEFKEFRSENKIEDIQPGITFNVPVYKWECSYCSFTKHCSAPYKTK